MSPILRARKLKHLGLVLFLYLSITACGPGSHFETIWGGNPGPGETIEPKPGNPPGMEALLWESLNPQGKTWSQIVFNALKGSASSLINKSDDMEIFCPKYAELQETQKINAVGMLISAMVRYESNFDPLARLAEPSLGTDPITGQMVYSEGLLQLSYQDGIGRSYCKFDWDLDKKLSPKDPKKSILDPARNLDCGVRILAEQVDKYGSLVIEHGAYWAVIRKNGKFQKINEIASKVQTLSFCK